jgi:hypothetical protein
MAGQIADMQSAGELQASYSGHSIDAVTKVYQNIKKKKLNARCHK